MIHNLDDLDNINEDYENIDFDNLDINRDFDYYLNIICNQEICIDDKIKVVNIIQNKFKSKTAEFIQKMLGMYRLTEISYLTKFLSRLVKESCLDFSYKVEIAKTLSFFDNNNKDLLHLAEKIDNDNLIIPDLIYFDIVRNLVQNKIYYDHGLIHLKKFIESYHVDIDFKYQSLYIIPNFDLEKDKCQKLFLDMLFYFYNFVPFITYKVLVCQYYIINEPNDERNTILIESLFTFANDEELDENIRADCLDVLMRCKDKKIRERAFTNIQSIGLRQNKLSIYNNTQNVHSASIDNSSIRMINKLNKDIKEKEIGIIPFSDVKAFFYKLINPEEEKNENEEKKKNETNEDNVEKKEKHDEFIIELTDYEKNILKKSINRIANDRANYGEENLYLSNILSLVFSYIQNNEYREGLLNRLIEELIDSSGVCSTGNAYRLINVLSGFDDYYITISFEEQFKSRFQIKIEQKCNDIENEDFRNDVLMEMITNDGLSSKLNFHSFFIKTYPKIEKELQEEFKNDISENEFQEYIRTCVSFYLNH